SPGLTSRTSRPCYLRRSIGTARGYPTTACRLPIQCTDGCCTESSHCCWSNQLLPGGLAGVADETSTCACPKFGGKSNTASLAVAMGMDLGSLGDPFVRGGRNRDCRL